MGCTEKFYSAAWSILEKEFGRPLVIMDAAREPARSKSSEIPQLSDPDSVFCDCIQNC